MFSAAFQPLPPSIERSASLADEGDTIEESMELDEGPNPGGIFFSGVDPALSPEHFKVTGRHSGNIGPDGWLKPARFAYGSHFITGFSSIL